MESDDMSLLEISGEDDSLLPLQQIPSGDVSSLNKTYFTCSPLQFPGSNRSVKRPPLPPPIEGSRVNQDGEKLNSSLNRDSVYKENMNLNKAEVQKLSMEPQQMKRKKKAGGYNLRKSLAWDRAFFTEEGVLNPLELSMISGNLGKCSGEMEMLSVIHEDGRESLAGDSKDLTALEENLFKELPASTRKEDMKKGTTSSTKNSPSTSAAKRKVLSAQDVNRSGSKRSGCPRPVASSSLKRPAIANTTKAATKELKVSRIPVRKPDPPVRPATAKSTVQGVSNLKRASNSKESQIAQPAACVQRNSGLKCSSTSCKSARSDARSGSDSSRSVTVKTSVQKARRNVAGSALYIHSSTNSKHPVITKTNTVSKINPGPALQASGHGSNDCDSDSNKVEIPIPPTGPSRGRSMQHTQLPTAKPSGLRMPSPSLRLFDQPKSSTSHSVFQGSNQICNVFESNIPCLSKFGALNSIHEKPIPATRKTPGLVKGVTASANMKISGSVTESCIPTNLNPESQEKMKTNLLKNDTLKGEMNVPSKSNSLDVLHNQQSLHILCNDGGQQSLQNVEPSKMAKISCAVANELQSCEKKLLLQSAPCNQSKKDDANGKVANTYPAGPDLNGPKLENPQITAYPQPAVQVEGVSETKDIADNQFEEDKTSNSLSKNDGEQSRDANDAFSESQARDANSNCIKGSLRKHDDWLSSVHDVSEQSAKQAEEMMPCTFEVDQIYSESQMPCTSNGTFNRENRPLSEFRKCVSTKNTDFSPEDTCFRGGELESPHGTFQFKNIEEAEDGILSIGRGKVVVCSSAVDNMVVDEENENAIDSNGSDSKSINDVTPMSGCHNVIDANGSDSAEQADGFDKDITIEYAPEDETMSDFVDKEFRRDIKPHAQTTSATSEMTVKDQITASVASSDIEGSSVCPNNRRELENSPFMTFQPSSVVQLEVGSEVNDTIGALQLKVGSVMNDINQQKDVEDELNNQHTDSDLQHGDDVSYCQQTTSTLHTDQLNCMNVRKQSMEGNQVSKVFDELLIEEAPCQVSKEFKTGEVGDVSPNAKRFGGSELESPHVHFHHEHINQANEEVAGVENPLVDDAQMQVLEGSLSVDSHDCNLNASTVKNKSSVAVEYGLEDATMSSYGSFIQDVDVKMLNSDVLSKEAETLTSQNNGGVLLVEDAQTQVFDGSLSVDGNDYNLNASTVKNESSVVVDDTMYGPEDATISSNGSVIQDVNVNVMNSDVLPKEAQNICSQNSGGFLLVENAQMHVLDGSLSVDGSDCNLNDSTVKNESSVVVDDTMYGPEDATILSNGSVIPDVNVNVLNSDVLPKEAETITSQNNGGVLPVEDAQMQVLDRSLSSDGNDCNLNASTVKHESSAVVEDAIYGPEDLKMSSNGSVFQDVNVNALNSDVSPEDAESITSQNNSGVLLVEDAQMHILDGTFSVDYNDFNLNASTVENKSSVVDDAMYGLEDTTMSLNGSVIQNVNANALNSDVLPGEAETITSQNNSGPKSEMHHELEHAACATEDMDATKFHKKSGNDTKQDNLVIKPPPHAVPFSDEWLAAFEAAGEEILTMKRGAVQNSPPDKTQPEPGPWSPVKRKNNQGIGPYDCTKFTNTTNIPPHFTSD